MKFVILTLITVYQKIISPLLHQLLGQRNLCRYEVSCSEFAKNAITKHGIINGGKMTLVRLISCQPFTKHYATI